MNKLWLLLFALPAFAQSPVIGGAVSYVSTAPSGSCAQAPPIDVLNSNGHPWTCANGTWTDQGGGGGGGATSVSNSDGTLTISPTTGAVVGSIALGHVNTWTGAQTFPTGSAGVTQSAGDTSTKLATDAFVAAATSAIPRSALGIVYNPVAYSAYGDSITLGTGPTYISNSYVNRVTQALGIMSGGLTNYGTGSAQQSDVNNKQIFPNDSPSVVPQQPLRTMMAGTNEANNGYGSAYQTTFNTLQQAAMTWLATPVQNKVVGSSATPSGTCANDVTYAAVTGENCTSNAATLSFSLTTYGQPIYIWYRTINSDAGTWTYQVDSGSAVNATTALATAFNSGNSSTTTVALIRVTGIATGSHTILFTKTNGTGNMPILAVGTVPPTPALSSTANQVTASMPYLIVGVIPPQGSLANNTAVQLYQGYVLANVALLAGDGLNVYAARVDQTVQGTAAAGDMGASANLHPTDAGSGEIAAAFLSAAPVAPGLNSATFYTPTSAQSTNGPGSQIILSASSFTCTTQPTGTVIWLFNNSSANLTTTSCDPSGESNQFNSTIPAYSAIELVSVSGHWWLIGSTNGTGLPYYTTATPASQTQSDFVSGGTLTLPTKSGGLMLYVANFSTTTATTVTNGQGGDVPASSTIPPSSGVTYCSAGNGWYYCGQSTGTRGTATLSSGTVTVSTTSSCAVSATCVYKLANCGPNSSLGIGTLSVGTVSAATSFVINSLSPTNTVLTTDASTVCWEIN